MKTASNDTRTRCLILGIGNLLMGDEGVGVHVARELLGRDLPAGVRCVDGGTGGLHLLDELQSVPRVVLIDATVDGAPAGTVRRIRPRFSTDYPPSLTAHDIGLKDLLDALYLLGDPPVVDLFAVSIEPLGELDTELSPRLRELVAGIADDVLAVATKRA